MPCKCHTLLCTGSSSDLSRGSLWQQRLSGGVGGISCWQRLVGTPEVSSAQLRTAGQRGSHIKIEEGDRDKGMGCSMRLVGTFSPECALGVGGWDCPCFSQKQGPCLSFVWKDFLSGNPLCHPPVQPWQCVCFVLPAQPWSVYKPPSPFQAVVQLH